ncbi:hypothetical protein BBJ28_00025697 [Nothophytophthora sp. Chile5]|nr:hypothetical protein BBJ28_00025697 [Nothophytophthora sp. Chile5]
MKFQATALLFAVSANAASADDCSTAPFASCGSDSGVTCCSDGYYCQPWDSSFYQCIQPPSQCTEQLTNVEFDGDDLQTVYGIQPSECCSQCASTSGCAAYTFVNSNPGQPACYLKSGTGIQKTTVGAVSGVVTSGSTNATTPAATATVAPTPTATPTVTPAPDATTATPDATTAAPSSDCSTALYATCGSSAGTTCCPDGAYCVPWSSDFYQCIAVPSQCTKQETDTTFSGETLKNVSVTMPDLCCDACASTDGCKAYTYINNNPGQPACILKSSVGVSSTLVGAVSGQLN